MADVKGGYARPTSTNFISSSWQQHKNRNPPSGEPGTDYGCNYGSTLYAAENGVIGGIKTDTSGAMGRFVWLKLDDGRSVRYLHLATVGVTTGQRVTRGQILGTTGGSANGSNRGVGSHVHTTLFPGHSYDWAHTIDFETQVGGDNDTAGGGTPGRAGYADGSNELIAFQKKLIQMGHDLGSTGADGRYGPKTKAATLAVQKVAESTGYPGGVVVDDGIPGPGTNAFLDWWLVGRHQNQGHTATVNDLGSLPDKRGLQKIAKLYGYTGGLDNDWGPGSKGGFQRFLDRNYRGSLVQWLRVKYGYVGNEIWGPVMAAAATRANNANMAAL